MKATAVVPVKRFRGSKRRLSDEVGDPTRTRIVRAMLDDVLAAVGKAAAIERVIVVTGERRAERIAMWQAKRTSVPLEVLRDPRDKGHSEAATLGALRAIALGAECVALLPGDCPLLDPAELDEAIGRVVTGRVTIVPDRHLTGTNGLLLAPPLAIGPAFGEGSRERHERLAHDAGHEPVVEPLTSMALDLDTPADLEALQAELEHDPDRARSTAAALHELATGGRRTSRPAGARV
jgi:2-phospho-L-lactate guanylyltransferase